jgi:hypothetical protein
MPLILASSKVLPDRRMEIVSSVVGVAIEIKSVTVPGDIAEKIFAECL